MEDVEGLEKPSQRSADEPGRPGVQELRDPGPPTEGSSQGIWTLPGAWWALRKGFGVELRDIR